MKVRHSAPSSKIRASPPRNRPTGYPREKKRRHEAICGRQAGTQTHTHATANSRWGAIPREKTKLTLPEKPGVNLENFCHMSFILFPTTDTIAACMLQMEGKSDEQKQHRQKTRNRATAFNETP